MDARFVTQHSFAFYLDFHLCLFPASQQTRTEACWDPEVLAHDSSGICWCTEGPSWVSAENMDDLQVNRNVDIQVENLEEIFISVVNV